MKEARYKAMKDMILNLAEWFNTPDEQLENMLGVSWMQFHELRRALEEEE